MDDPLGVGLLIVIGLVASVAALRGLPDCPSLVAVFGVRDAIPILTIAQIVGNSSRSWFNRKEISYRVVWWFSLGSVPAGVLGGLLFASAPLAALHGLLGVILLLIVVYRRLPPKDEKKEQMKLWWFAPIGAVGNFLSALVGSVGPLMAPFFLAFGLTKGAYIGTEALTAVIMHLTKTATYGGLNLLSVKNLGVGLMLGAVLVVGSYFGKRLVDKVSERAFVVIIELMLVVVGLYFIIAGTVTGE